MVTQDLLRHSVKEDVLDKLLQRGKFSVCIRKHQPVEETVFKTTWATLQWMGWHKDKQSTEEGLRLLKFLLSPEAYVRLSDKAGAQICG